MFDFGSQIHSQIIAFLNGLFQLGIHPRHLSFARLGFLGDYERPLNVLTGTRLMALHVYRYRRICESVANLLFGNVASSDMVTLHINVLIPDMQQRDVVGTRTVQSWNPM